VPVTLARRLCLSGPLARGRPAHIELPFPCHADALAVFWDGDAECVALAAEAKKRKVPVRLVRVPGGEVAHLPLWDDLLLAAGG
jgi:hypothetical protein